MVKIESADAAQRLASALLADIRLYNAEAIANGDDLTEVLSEARALYQSRVVPQWHALFEQTVTAALTGQTRSDQSETHLITQPVTSHQGTKASSSASNIAWIAFGLLGLTATIVWKLLKAS